MSNLGELFGIYSFEFFDFFESAVKSDGRRLADVLSEISDIFGTRSIKKP